jgi:hypothetical protein
VADEDPLRQIAQCHAKIAGPLARLDALVAGDGGTAALGAALPPIVRWFETNGLRHRTDEEESLFPRLAACAAAPRRPHTRRRGARGHRRRDGIPACGDAVPLRRDA